MFLTLFRDNNKKIVEEVRVESAEPIMPRNGINARFSMTLMIAANAIFFTLIFGFPSAAINSIRSNANP